jgi:hypothetical protein
MSPAAATARTDSLRELCRLAAPSPLGVVVRQLAWANSVCAVGLLVGLGGGPSRVAESLRPAAVEETFLTVFEPPAQRVGVGQEARV